MLKLWGFDNVPAERLQLLADNANIARNLRDIFPHPYTVTDAEEFIDAAVQGNIPHVFGIFEDDEFIGVGGITVKTDIHRNSAEVGYWIGEPYWGKGYATTAVKLLTEYAFNIGLIRVFAGVFAHNKASQRVLEKAGYILEAVLRSAITKNGEVMDEYLYAIIKS
ncbi:GNAT family N-acetyltransferase [Mucilaginibacter sp. UR6-1]|uniref:GNAT family N-acetyltransferase n=1 Tax=Mucilaginibacter sp. UR6-1 TaxID=1435643 RepID=UPI001E4945E5|nr:GNAT family protein [Mucilaginibacter sp. UR6-1]MCC8408822.1 GNAT family N-acetyltransferase [Mucilaginibacter sp. UR6-1]